MLSQNLYARLKKYNSRPALWGLRQVFRLHARDLEKKLRTQFDDATFIASRQAKKCADMMAKLGTHEMQILREWSSVHFPEKLTPGEIGPFHNHLEKIVTSDPRHPYGF